MIEGRGERKVKIIQNKKGTRYFFYRIAIMMFQSQFIRSPLPGSILLFTDIRTNFK